MKGEVDMRANGDDRETKKSLCMAKHTTHAQPYTTS